MEGYGKNWAHSEVQSERLRDSGQKYSWISKQNKKGEIYSFFFFFLTESVVKYWKRLSRVAVKSPFMEIFEALLEMTQSNLL